MTGFFIYIIIGVSLYYLLENGILEKMAERGIKDTKFGRLINITLMALFWLPIGLYALYMKAKS